MTKCKCSLSIAQEWAQYQAKLEEQNKQLHTQVSRLIENLGCNKASIKNDLEEQQTDSRSFCKKEDIGDTALVDQYSTLCRAIHRRKSWNAYANITHTLHLIELH